MAQFVLLGDAAESALLRGEENVGMGEAEMLDFWGASVWMSKKGKRKRLCMHQVKESKVSREVMALP